MEEVVARGVVNVYSQRLHCRAYGIWGQPYLLFSAQTLNFPLHSKTGWPVSTSLTENSPWV